MNKINHDRTQVLFFSATFDPQILNFGRSLIKDPSIIQLKKTELSLKNVQEYWVDCVGPNRKDIRFEKIVDIYDTIQVTQAIIFVEVRKKTITLIRIFEIHESNIYLFYLFFQVN
jgi:superfamily II DNA/RNA helicase